MANYAPDIPDPNRVSIVDVSFYQNTLTTPQPIDFKKMRANGISGVIIRSGQGSYIDRDFKMNWKLAKEAGLPRGSYFYFDSRIKPERQAETWVSAFEGDFGEFHLWADFEDNYGGIFSGWKHWYPFLERVKQLIPNVKLGIYSAYYYFFENMAGTTTAQRNYFAQYPLWIAGYKTDKPLIPSPFKDYLIWQWTDNGDGYYYGAESRELDMNYFNGTMEEWIKYSGGFTNDGEKPVELPVIPPSKYPNISEAILKFSDGKIQTFKNK